MDEKSLLRKVWVILKVGICYALVIFFITVIGRIAHLYANLAQVHLFLGLLFVLLLVLPLIYLGWQVGSLWIRVPSAIRPPSRDLYDENPAAYEKKCLDFSRLLVRNLLLNPNLDDDDRAMLNGVVPALEKHVAGHKSLVPAELQRVWDEKTAAVFAKLDRMAEKKTYRSANFTSLGTAASQNSVLDGIIQLYQMISLTVTIVKVYWTRPGMVVSFGLGRDILASAGSVILVSQITGGAYFKKVTAFITNAGDRIPGINIFTGLLDKGLQAGVSWQLVNRYGKAVMKRCRAIEWDNAQEREKMVQAAVESKGRFSQYDVMVTKRNVLELIRYFSWISGEQNPQIALFAMDYILRTFPSAREQGNLCKRLRTSPSVEGSIVQKALFWKKLPTSMPEVNKEAVEEFLTLAATIKPSSLSSTERMFVEELEKSYLKQEETGIRTIN